VATLPHFFANEQDVHDRIKMLVKPTTMRRWGDQGTNTNEQGRE
jgi:hypothetical protein